LDISFPPLPSLFLLLLSLLSFPRHTLSSASHRFAGALLEKVTMHAGYSVLISMTTQWRKDYRPTA
jgi:hypothetical protein